MHPGLEIFNLDDPARRFQAALSCEDIEKGKAYGITASKGLVILLMPPANGNYKLHPNDARGFASAIIQAAGIAEKQLHSRKTS